jgi:arsenate reductase (thioredoxin)
MPETVKTKVLFVCMGNCVRSQMAEAIARHTASDVIAAESAGIRPLGFIDPTAQKVLSSRGISFDGQFSKGLHSHKLSKPDLIVNMSGLPGNSLFHAELFEDWRVPDPFGDDVETHCRVCDDIESRVRNLAERLRAAHAGDSFPDGAQQGEEIGQR